MQTEISAPQKKHDHGWTLTFIILAITIIAAVFYAGGIIPEVKKIYFLKDSEGIPVQKDNFASGSSLLIDTLTFTTVTPRPTLVIPPGAQQNTPTPSCTDDVAIDFLIDTSKSMQGNKIQQVRNALQLFGTKLSNNSIIGMQTFGGVAQERLPISLYSNVQQDYINLAQNLSTDIEGGTYTRNGFTLARTKLTEAKQQFPDREFKLIFLSDGIPETYEYNLVCSTEFQLTGNLSGTCADNCSINGLNLKCFAPQQSPNTAPSVAQSIKNSGVEIFSIALLDEIDTRFNTQLEELMKDAASSPDKFYKTFNAEDLDTIYNQIAVQVCN